MFANTSMAGTTRIASTGRTEVSGMPTCAANNDHSQWPRPSGGDPKYNAHEREGRCLPSHRRGYLPGGKAEGFQQSQVPTAPAHGSRQRMADQGGAKKSQ